MSKYIEEEQYEKYINHKKKYPKGQNSKIQKILTRIDHIETLLIRLTKAFHIEQQPSALSRDEISFVGESGSDTETEDK